MTAVDCKCAAGIPGADEHCDELHRSGKPLECGFHFQCDRCGVDIYPQNHAESLAFTRKQQDFTDAFSSFAHQSGLPMSKSMLAREVGWPAYDFCDGCHSQIMRWAPIMADVLYLKTETNRLYRTIQNVKKDRNNRAIA